MKNLNFIRILFIYLIFLIPFIAVGSEFESGLEAYYQGDYATAIFYWSSLAENGDPEAQFNIGSLYMRGEGFNQDEGKATRWFKLAAEQGNVFAQNELGYIHYIGKGILRAYMWWDIAAQRGNKEAEINKNFIAAKMNGPDVLRAKKMTKRCLKNKYKNC